MPGDDCRFWKRLIADKGIGLQLAVSGLLCQRLKSGSDPLDHVEDPDLCLLSIYLVIQKARKGSSIG